MIHRQLRAGHPPFARFRFPVDYYFISGHVLLRKQDEQELPRLTIASQPYSPLITGQTHQYDSTWNIGPLDNQDIFLGSSMMYVCP
jgi:hypothetical protein